ncbi:cell division protein FtsZ [Ehrlichia chaffeensis str. Heartland]|uniref:Cell division protein FtsZ n=1 Tax=Ehrlichia chaffeensis TaxID=945 RepID=Q9AQ38_EHRCH|nr:cell division protein FtsZ [Ehrlichia chaffeensis]AAK00615.2 cell division protein FtsZ [Ehrlichia chaffeensis]AHX03212.1 cell division protein FtsZ [Ehrlichia chaffeensis str. Heartland]AHX05128.1 cell division protein FtsZ [Ehrlichia chaffeensis str. Jax]AHX08622.1 cell division protein FtsZ [Ehrlichia chaffeensis str. Saint Vincent]AHX10020.1 cell division protein FtsZ [Ehrlichia chaffeensis str. West Paces]
MSLNICLPDQSLLRPRITVFGVGGAGGNAVNNMIQSNLHGVNFVVANTDAQALELSLSEKKIQLGIGLTKGLGAGSLPEVGRGAAEESINEIIEEISDSNMLFITAGMGGGTGTGAAPVIARVAKENKILTIGVVTKPFHFEGAHRMRTAEFGLEELQRYVDTLIVIPNQNLFRIANEKTTFADAFKLADTVLHTGVRGITDLMVMPGLINLDFADIRAIMSEMGKAMMGTGEAEGENRAIAAAEAAISNPLLDNISMKGAKGILINITGGLDMTLFEVDAAANRIREEVDSHANIIFGSTFNKESEGKIRVSVLATGIDNEEVVIQNKSALKDKEAHNDKLSETSSKPFNPLDNEIAYYKPSNPGEDMINSINHTKKQDHNIENQKSNNKIPESAYKMQFNKNEYWDEESFNIPTFLRKK